jgi:hypothetical protein
MHHASCMMHIYTCSWVEGSHRNLERWMGDWTDDNNGGQH